MPLVTEAYDWAQGVYLASNVASEGTAAAEGAIGELRRDPFAMLPFCGYNMGDYFQHWLDLGERGDAAALPRIFFVNWFRKGMDGRYLWPGYGENARVLEWIFRRRDGDAEARETPTGWVPRPEDLNTDGLAITPERLEALLNVDEEGLRDEVEQIREHLAKFGERLPAEIRKQFEALEARLA